MIVYNISIRINAAIETDWVNWQQKEHIPEIMATGFFSDYKFYRLLSEEDPDHPTYVVQFFALTMEHCNNYIEKMSPALRQKSFNKWGDNFIAFRTLMQAVN